MTRREVKPGSRIALPLMAKVAREYADQKAIEARAARRKERGNLRPFDKKTHDRSINPDGNWERRHKAEETARAAERLACALSEFMRAEEPSRIEISTDELALLRRIDAGEVVHELPDYLAGLALAVPRIVRRAGQVVACLTLSGDGHKLLAELEER
ncbi:MAG: hypothetical protein GY947_09295 [Rhodobacteraceae bacterium]|nr:hypothetical protein [Paracoccaceae bacterium]